VGPNLRDKETIMANITRFNPFEELAGFRPLANFDDLFKGFGVRPWAEAQIEPRIKVDVSETDTTYGVKAEIPGVKKEDIHVAIEGNQVSIEAELRKEKEEKKGEKVVRSERYTGKQYRSFTLGCDIDAGKAEAKYADGVLELKLPKKSNGSSKELKVQ
jgi:HSP20 family protein